MEKSTAVTIVKVYAVLAWIGALFALLGALALFFGGSFLGILVPGMSQGRLAAGALSGLSILLGIVLLAVAIFDVIVGWGLWNLRSWARVAAIVMSVISLLSIPVGTVIGIIGIWLFGFESTIKGLFGAEGRASASHTFARRK